MEIGLFQLENLITTPARFRLFDLRADKKTIHPGVDRLLAGAVQVTSDNFLGQVRQEKLPLDFPLILICETGDHSKRLAAQLEKSGHTNVYVVEGGAEGLLSEL